jgi:ABC-type transport system involved in cytochrome bd biosynthesis fused ATPase/permease subunit
MKSEFQRSLQAAIGPVFLEWIYFLCLAGGVILMGRMESGWSGAIGATALLFLMYQPLREWSRQSGLAREAKDMKEKDRLRLEIWKRESADLPTSVKQGSNQSATNFNALEPGGDDAQKGNSWFGIQGLSFGYSEKRDLFREDDFLFATHQWTWLQGPNGAGKSSLLRILAGLEKPLKANWIIPKVSRGGTDDELERLKMKTTEWKWQYLPQPPIPEADVLNWLRDFQADSQAKEWIRFFGLVDCLPEWIAKEQKSFSPSQGERQRLGLLRAFTGDAKFLLLDEPTLGLPEPEVERIFSGLFLGKGDAPPHGVRGGIIASHDSRFGYFCAKVLEIQKVKPEG